MNKFENGYHGNSEDLPARIPHNGTEKIYKNTVDNMVDPDSQEPYRELFGNKKENLPQHGEHEDTGPDSRIWNGYIGAFVEQNNTVEDSDTEEVAQDKIIDSMFENGYQDENIEHTDQNETQLTENEIENAGKLVSNKEPLADWKHHTERELVYREDLRKDYTWKDNMKTMPDSEIERMNRGKLAELKKHNTWDENTFWDNMEDENFMPHYLLESTTEE